MSVKFWKVNAKTSRSRILIIIAKVTALAVAKQMGSVLSAVKMRAKAPATSASRSSYIVSERQVLPC